MFSKQGKPNSTVVVGLCAGAIVAAMVAYPAEGAGAGSMDRTWKATPKFRCCQPMIAFISHPWPRTINRTVLSFAVLEQFIS